MNWTYRCIQLHELDSKAHQHNLLIRWQLLLRTVFLFQNWKKPKWHSEVHCEKFLSTAEILVVQWGTFESLLNPTFVYHTVKWKSVFQRKKIIWKNSHKHGPNFYPKHLPQIIQKISQKCLKSCPRNFPPKLPNL